MSAEIQKVLDRLYPNFSFFDFQVAFYLALGGFETLYPHLQEGMCFVVFESEQYPDVDKNSLHDLDYAAFLEAKQQEGFKGYYRGPMDNTTKLCRSFCLWENPAAAHATLSFPEHKVAAGSAHQMYKTFNVRRYIVEKNRITEQLEIFELTQKGED